MRFVCSCGATYEIPDSGWAYLREITELHAGCLDRAKPQGYEEAWRAGYAKGADAGSAIGYSDAKARAYLALDALERELLRESLALAPKEIIRRVNDVIKTVVGARP